MWHIGDLGIDGKVVSGPLSGYTTEAYRDFLRPFGVAVEYTEMVSDQGCIHGQKTTENFIKYERKGITGVQLFGSDPDSLAHAALQALKINPDIDFFDINMGCPVPKVNRTGAGSALMKDPKRCGDIIRTMKRELSIPVTAKIRLGWTISNPNFRKVIEELEAADVDAVCIHPRTREERYSGTPHYDLLEGLGHEMSVPLIISGNIYNLNDAIEKVALTGAEGVMVARGGIGNPYLITQIDRYFRTGEVLPNPTISQQIDWCLQIAEMLVQESGEEVAVRRLRSIAPKFIAGCFKGKEYRNLLATQTVSIEGLKADLERIREAIGDDVAHNRGLPSEEDSSF